METIKWGIIGCGDVTEVKSGPAFNKVGNSSLIAVMRRDAAKAKDYAERHNVPKWYSDAYQLINDPDINAVYVATPPQWHEEYTIAALQSGKPVYVEKPMALDAAGSERMLKAAIQNNIKLTVAHYRREQPMFKKIKELLDDKTIGDIRFADLLFLQPAPSSAALEEPKTKWRVDPSVSGGGLFHDLAPHQLDLMLYYFGDVKSAAGVCANQGSLYGADDIVSGNILFNNKVIFRGLWSFAAPEDDKTDNCSITGSEGKISFSVFNDPCITVIKNGETDTINFERLEHVQQPMIAKVVEYFTGIGPNPCSGENGLNVMRLMEDFTKK